MRHITVNAEHEYKVHIDEHFEGVLHDVSQSHSKVFILTTQYLADTYHIEKFLHPIDNAVIHIVSDGEHQKDISVLEQQQILAVLLLQLGSAVFLGMQFLPL